MSRLSALPLRQRHLRRMIATHTVHSPAWRSACRANINIARRRSVMSPRRAKQKLAQVQRPASHIPSYKISVHALQALWRKDASRQYAVAEARSESLDLILQSLQHVHPRPIGNMTIRPSRVFTRWRARAIEKTRLNQQNERTLGVISISYRLFRRSDLLKAPAQMYGRCPQAIGS